MQVFNCHHFVIDEVPLSHILLLLGMTDDSITAFRGQVDALFQLLVTPDSYKLSRIVLDGEIST